MRPSPVMLIMAALLVSVSLLMAQDQTSGSGTLRVQFQNARTGQAVIPDKVMFSGKEHGGRADKSGAMAVTLENGEHDIEVHAEGFLPMIATVTVEGEGTMTNIFELDPESSEDQNELDPKTAIIAGHVVDDMTGSLLPDVEIAIPEKQSVTRTDAHGQFSLSISTPEATAEKPVTLKVSMVISKDDYVSEERSNVELVSGNEKQVTYRLDPVSDEMAVNRKVIDEGREQETERLFSWTYDITFD